MPYQYTIRLLKTSHSVVPLLPAASRPCIQRCFSNAKLLDYENGSLYLIIASGYQYLVSTTAPLAKAKQRYQGNRGSAEALRRSLSLHASLSVDQPFAVLLAILSPV